MLLAKRRHPDLEVFAHLNLEIGAFRVPSRCSFIASERLSRNLEKVFREDNVAVLINIPTSYRLIRDPDSVDCLLEMRSGSRINVADTPGSSPAYVPEMVLEGEGSTLPYHST